MIKIKKGGLKLIYMKCIIMHINMLKMLSKDTNQKYKNI